MWTNEIRVGQKKCWHQGDGLKGLFLYFTTPWLSLFSMLVLIEAFGSNISTLWKCPGATWRTLCHCVFCVCARGHSTDIKLNDSDNFTICSKPRKTPFNIHSLTGSASFQHLLIPWVSQKWHQHSISNLSGQIETGAVAMPADATSNANVLCTMKDFICPERGHILPILVCWEPFLRGNKCEKMRSHNTFRRNCWRLSYLTIFFVLMAECECSRVLCVCNPPAQSLCRCPWWPMRTLA